jgi:hypothetical protein
LKAKIKAGMGTAEDKAELKRLIGPTPVVQIGEKLLKPEQRLIAAEKAFKQKIRGEPLSPTEKKGVKTTIGEILGEGKALPFGVRPGPALTQEDMNKLWENTMEATGYSGRDTTAQKQIEQEFDMQVKVQRSRNATRTKNRGS